MIAKMAAAALCMVLFSSLSYGADCNSGGRYEDNGDGSVTDCRTGLAWLKNANCTTMLNGIDKTSGYLNWNDAMQWVAGLGNGSCGLTDGSSLGDWRLPTKTEWMAMVAYAKKQGMTPTITNAAGTLVWTAGDPSKPFTNVYDGTSPSTTYWAITTYPGNDSWVSYVDLVSGNTAFSMKYLYAYVWPVRAGSTASLRNITIE
jgi:hypothetical protein